LLNKEEEIKARPASQPMIATDDGINILKGEELGWFEMGSTIVLIFEGPQDTVLHVKEGQRLHLGDHIVTTAKATADSQ
jgi:phosphatidylserine decarboxylase